MATCKFYTLGCKTNYYETQLMRERLLRGGFKEIASGEGGAADIFVINTCTVTQKADRESRAALRQALKNNPSAVVVAAGCYAEAEREDIKEIIGERGIIIGNKDKDNIAALLGLTKSLAHSPQSTAHSSISTFANRTRAFVKIQDGCDNRCSYCKIPYVRGNSASRPLDEVIPEVKGLVSNGFKEVVLTGICAGSYKDDSCDIVDVAEMVADIPGLLRLRLSSIEPKYISERLVNMIAKSQKICRHLHIPFQSADDDMLRRMCRHYMVSDYLNVIDMVKRHLPDASISTDIIVGFPGEDETAFENTIRFLDILKPIKVHIFPFSPRPATPACYYRDRIPPYIITKRIERLYSISNSIALKHLNQFVDKDVEVLIESRQTDGCFSGYTDTYIKVMASADPDFPINTLQNVRIETVDNNYLIGRII